MPAAFHEIRFPVSVALSGSGGPTRKTEIVITGSGREERIARWTRSRHVYDAGTGVKTLADLARVLEFFEERRGRLFGFRWRDRADYSSAMIGNPVSARDQVIGVGDGVTARFPLVKHYGRDHAPYRRLIEKPVAGTVRIAVDDQEINIGSDVAVDITSGVLAFPTGKIPPAGAIVRAGFEFDVPVRFDTDELLIDHAAFIAGEIPKIPLVEIIP